MKNSLFILIALIIISCSESKIVPKISDENIENEGTPDQISYDIEVLFADSIYKKAKLKAQRARIYKENKETLLDGGVRVEFFSKQSGKRVSTLTSDSVKIDDKTKNMFAGGNVLVVSDSNRTTLKTNILEWNNTTEKLYSNEFVTIKSPYETIRGVGFESDQNLQNYKVYKVSGEQRQK